MAFTSLIMLQLTRGCLKTLDDSLVYLCSVASVMSNSFVTPWTVTRQAPLSKGFCRQEDWSGLPFMSPLNTTPFVFLERGYKQIDNCGLF